MGETYPGHYIQTGEWTNGQKNRHTNQWMGGQTDTWTIDC